VNILLDRTCHFHFHGGSTSQATSQHEADIAFLLAIFFDLKDVTRLRPAKRRFEFQQDYTRYISEVKLKKAILIAGCGSL
jgi:hypothetical protein